MLLELTPAFSPQQRYDVCIIGAGAAGIVLARKLAQAGHQVLLAEAGGLEYSDLSQSNYQGDVIGDTYIDLDVARLRYFGGSTNHWSGVSRPFDSWDFWARPYLGLPSWPITGSDLDPYLDETLDILGLDPIPDAVALPGSTDLLQFFWGFGEPVRFGEKYLEEIRESKNIDLLINANCVGFERQDATMTGIHLENYDRYRVKIEAKKFVLACGGIENCRILLIENRKCNNVLGNTYGLVGRYFSEHPHFTIGEYFLYHGHPFQLDQSSVGIFMIPTPGFLKRMRILNCRIDFDVFEPRPGWRSFVQSAMCGVAPDMSDSMLEALGRRFICGGSVRASWEQESRAENRIALADDVDLFGNPRPQMIWRKSALDKRTFTTLALEVGRYLAERDAGRLRLYEWVLDEDGEYPVHDRIGGKHHMGGTRMAASPRDGVVDENCRVFGTDNLYVAGSSVFPSGGQTNPTLPIVQMSLRLADFLAADLLRS